MGLVIETGDAPMPRSRPVKRLSEGVLAELCTQLVSLLDSDRGWISTRLQGWQGRTGAQTCAPRPAPPGKICAPRPAPPCAPGLTRVTTPGSHSITNSVQSSPDALSGVL